MMARQETQDASQVAPIVRDVDWARVTRRRRLTVATVIGMVASGAVFGLASAQADSPTDPIPVSIYTVSSGDTLWQIAGSVTGEGEDIRSVLLDIAELNGIDGSRIVPGQQLVLPRS